MKSASCDCLARWTFALIGLASMARAETVTVRPAADTTLFESAPNDNMGGWTHVVSGTTGSQADRTRNRGLLRFDVAGSVPAGAQVISARLALEVVRIPANVGGGGPVASVFGLHRVLRPWGEGDKLGDRGFPADSGEATWNHRFAFAQSWTSPGGAAGSDFAESPSATTAISGKARYEFGPAPALAADVQAWLDRPADNHGWLLLSQSEGSQKTARAFGSREDPDHAPQLVIEFEPAFPLTLVIEKIEPHTVRISFAAREGRTYELQAAPSVAAGDWETVITFPSGPSRAVITEQPATGRERYYRLREE